MISQKQRISRGEFQSLLKKGRSFHSPLFSLSISKDVPGERFAVVVSKKVAKKAVRRNKLRRWAYSILQKHQDSIFSDVACIFFYKKTPEDISFQDVEKQIVDVLKKAHVYKK
jgi:ribonuclease P protein component